MALNVITWLWGDKYGATDVIKLATQVRRNLGREHRFHLFTDRSGLDLGDAVNVHPIDDAELCGQGCLCRLRMFDPAWQAHYAFNGDIVSLDLDLVITGELDGLFKTDNSFMILHGANAVNPCLFNGSVMLLKTRHHSEVWNGFSLEAVAKVPYYAFPDDQSWIWHKLPKASGWKVGKPSGIYAFQKPGWPDGYLKYALPADAKIVAFIGKRKPSQYATLPWIKQYWTEVA